MDRGVHAWPLWAAAGPRRLWVSPSRLCQNYTKGTWLSRMRVWARSKLTTFPRGAIEPSTTGLDPIVNGAQNKMTLFRKWSWTWLYWVQLV
jgi:hypothetical protein